MRCVICLEFYQTNYRQAITCGDESCKKRNRKKKRTQWVKANQDYFNAYKRQYHATKDKARVAAKQKARRKSPEGKAYRAAQQRLRLQRDPLYKAKRALRKRLWEYKKRLGSISMSRSIGCTWDEFKAHIEKQFYVCSKTGAMMNWDNYGGTSGWEMDHIVPLCAATSLMELEKLSHFTNIRPLWKHDNNLKSLEDIKLRPVPESMDR